FSLIPCIMCLPSGLPSSAKIYYQHTSIAGASFFFHAEDGIRAPLVTGVQTCALPIYFNHIVRGEQWQSYADLPRLFRAWRGFEKDAVFGNIELAAFNVVQVIGRGKVTMVVSPGRSEERRVGKECRCECSWEVERKVSR